ncbi:type II secretion system minor pseudopilin GspK [Hyphobacterium sp.]|uniref:type II secretion system minor pseudopilin GspK n=1 Tax=Hyphobacterium sp. TaxID=2004662 RepID=UPI00374A7A69
MRGVARKRGTALITALMITAVMSTVAVGLSQALFFGIDRSGHIEARDQAYWYAVGARDFAESALLRSLPPTGEPMRASDAWAQGPRQFEIENGALIGEVRDANNCFNLNALVSAAGRGGYAADEAAAERFIALIQALNIPAGDAQAIAAQATDWIDSDTRPEARGAEDMQYAQRRVPHRTANTLFVETEEILVLPVMTPLYFSRLAPLVCAHPVTEEIPLNLNTLRPEQAALLAAALDNQVSRSEAALLISRRPTTGYLEVEDFWRDPLVAELEISPENRPVFTLNSRYFEIHVDVQQGDSRYRLTERVELESSRRLTRHSQRFGVFL